MKHLQLTNGDRIPALGLGTWKSDPGEVGGAVCEAIRLGYRHIDCAAIYANEAEIGTALRAAFGAGDVRREDLWITSKLWNDVHLADSVRPALEKTLADLQLDALDLYLVHWPVALRPGVFIPERAEDFLSPEDAPLAETWRAMEACVEAGLCRHIGVSNFSVRRIRELLGTATMRPAMNQVELHPYLPQNDLVRECRELGILVTAYSPLGSPDRPEGLRKSDEPDLLANPVVVDVARQMGATPGQVLIRWAIQRGTIVIPKSVDPGRLAQNLAAAELEIPADGMARLDEVEGPYRLVDGSFWGVEGSPYTMERLWGE